MMSKKLITELTNLPANWQLTPLIEKRPYRLNWQDEAPIPRDALIQVIRNGEKVWSDRKNRQWTAYPTGYGIRLGKVSGGIVAIDFDGQSAWDLAQKLSNGDLPDTVAFTSNRPGRHQRLYQIPEEYWEAIATHKLKTGVKGDDGKPEQLEFRWSGCQSVLPPSKHPSTGEYSWINSPQDIEVAIAPMWVIEQMLPEPTPEPTPASRQPVLLRLPNNSDWTDTDWALSYLNALSPYRADDYDDWLAVGMALHSVDDSLLSEWDAWSRQSNKYQPGDCDKKWKSFSSSGKVSIGTLAQMAKQDGWQSPFEKKGSFSYQKKTQPLKKQNGSVTGDSSHPGDSQNLGVLSIAATVTTVTEILESGFPEWLEYHKLEDIRFNSELNNKQAFYALVNGIKTQFDEVQPEDEIRLKALIDWHNTELDFHSCLPSMADDILHDAKILNIDPIGLWQYLLPTVLSLCGKRVDLDVESHTIPAIAWTALVAESGSGKTRAEKLVTSPVKCMQQHANELFKAELEEWENWDSNENGGEKRPPLPKKRKFWFDVATIQAVMKRLSEQNKNGAIWARDELVGIFQSLNQFNKQESEGLSCLLASWDGGSSQVDRVNEEDSYFIESSRLSIAGGIQPGAFKKAFRDPNDPQGVQARFLFASMKPRKPKRVKGFCYLSEKLPQLYQWLDNIPEGKIKLSKAADTYYDKLYEVIGEQAFNTSMPAIRAWMFKLPAQLLRIALALHLIECYHEPNRPFWELQKDTLERAVLFAQYYRSTFHVVQNLAADTDDISAVLMQIWDKAITRHPEGISTRDAYREVKAIQYRAKDAGRSVSAYTADLFTKLEQMSKGKVIKKGRQIKFVATLNPPPITPTEEKENQKNRDSGDSVTEAETVVTTGITTVTENELSPVTVKVDKSSTEATQDAIATACSSERIAPNPTFEAPKTDSGENTAAPESAIDYKDVVAAIDSEMKRLGWTKEQGRDYLSEKYNKRSRQLLTDEELLEFLSYLKSNQVSFKVGQRVKLNMPGSVRHGMVGTVVRLKTDGSEQELIVKFDDRKLRRDLRQMECYADWLELID
jgi:hypothetical protein